jgi:hypothetical protein
MYFGLVLIYDTDKESVYEINYSHLSGRHVIAQAQSATGKRLPLLFQFCSKLILI